MSLLDAKGVSMRFGGVTALRSVDVRWVDGEPAFVLRRDELEEIEVAVSRYLGL